MSTPRSGFAICRGEWPHAGKHLCLALQMLLVIASLYFCRASTPSGKGRSRCARFILFRLLFDIDAARASRHTIFSPRRVSYDIAIHIDARASTACRHRLPLAVRRQLLPACFHAFSRSVDKPAVGFAFSAVLGSYWRKLIERPRGWYRRQFSDTTMAATSPLRAMTTTRRHMPGHAKKAIFRYRRQSPPLL